MRPTVRAGPDLTVNALLSLSEHPSGTTTGPGNRVTYDFDADEALFGAAVVAGPALCWELLGPGAAQPAAESAALAAAVHLDSARSWLMRCDRVDFPPGAVAYRHTHPGPGIRRLLFGELTITTGGVTNTYRAGDPWFESGPEPVYAESSALEPSAFVRVMLLPAEWAGRRTIRYADPADADRPARQRATVYLEGPLA